jgi:hypothetical protein
MGLKPGVLDITQRPVPRYATTAIERVLLVVNIMLLPLAEDIPSIAGFSIMYLALAAIAVYALLHRSRALARTWLHPIFLAAYTLTALALLIEYSHPESNTYEITRMGMMILAAVFIAALLRDRSALRACVYGFIVTGLAVSVYLFLSTYGTLRRSTVSDFNEASRLRVEAWNDSALQNSPNTMAFYAAQGAAAALALALAAKSLRRRMLFFGTSLFCLVGAFLPMSRGGILIAVISCGAVLFAHGVRHMGTIMAGLVLGIGILTLVPDAVFSRLTFTTRVYEGSGRMEGRARVYTSVVKHLPDYVALGVGSGNFWGSWGERSAFGDNGGVGGAHNGPSQILIYWGLPAFLAFVALLFQCYRCLPTHSGDDALILGMIGIAISVLLFMQVHHVLNAKSFSLGLGLLAGGSVWLWPKRMHSMATKLPGSRSLYQ